jgi:glucan phosphoethanolaminetransferase (alkaline phosphatase superfamily)
LEFSDHPLSNQIWLVIVILAFCISLFMYLVKIMNTEKEYKTVSSVKSRLKFLVIFTSLLAGTVVWISYRASLTSELAAAKKKLPFNDLESLSNTVQVNNCSSWNRNVWIV